MTKTVLNKRNVFLDTEVFISNNFRYLKDNLSRLTLFVQENRISLYSTQVTIEEVKANIEEAIIKAEKAIYLFRKEARILYNCQSPSFQCVFKKFDLDITKSELITQFERYINKCQTIILPINEVAIEEVFKKYFSKQPPFGEGKKKDEFPDAFVFSALELWCLKNKQQVYVISGDPDWKSACKDHPNLIYLEKLEPLYQLLEFDDKLIAEYSETFFNQHMQDIILRVTDQFDTLGFIVDSSNSSRIIEDEEVSNVEVETVVLSEEYVVKVEQNKLFYKCKFKVTFLADVSYIDYSDSPYDHEEGKYFYGENFEKTVKSTYLTNVDVEISFSQDDLRNSELEEVNIHEDDIIFDLEDEDEYPYK